MRHVSLWKSDISRYFFSILESVILLAVNSLCISGVLLLGSLPAGMLIWTMHILWSISAFCAGRRAGLHGRKYGILTGLLCGMLLCILLFVGCLLLQEAVTSRMLTRCLLILPSGIAGGVTGVNTKLRKPPY